MSAILPTPEHGNGSDYGLTAKQTLEMITMIDEKVDKSENRVVAAIVDLKADMRDMKADLKADMNDMKADIRAVNQKVDSLAADVADVKVGLATVKVEVGDRLRHQTWAVMGLVLSMFFALASYMTWLVQPAGGS